MIAISVKEFAKMHIRCNKSETEEGTVKKLEEALRRKEEGAECEICGQPIWALGSAMVFDGCFTCITGEADSSKDYEVTKNLC